MSNLKDLTNLKFGRLKVIKRVENNKRGRAMWLCKCDCGKEKITNGYVLLSGQTKSCGCFRKEQILKSVIKHNQTNTKLYYVWKEMKQRCYNNKNKNYHNYGGRGIQICNEWLNDFSSFYNWAINNGYNHNAIYKSCTIDRINNDGNYEPANCRWVDMKVQSNNKRRNKRR